MIASSGVALSLLFYAWFLAWIVVLIGTIVHCVRRVRPIWATVLVIFAMALLPLAGVAIYWVVFFVIDMRGERDPQPETS
jgi:hypothetical protein